MSTITAGELLYGALNKKERNQITRDIAHLQLLHLDPVVCECFLDLMIDYSLSHRLSLPDGLIAATALIEEIPLYTLNKKDFEYINGIQLYRWGSFALGIRTWRKNNRIPTVAGKGTEPTELNTELTEKNNERVVREKHSRESQSKKLHRIF